MTLARNGLRYELLHYLAEERRRLTFRNGVCVNLWSKKMKDPIILVALAEHTRSHARTHSLTRTLTWINVRFCGGQ
jgi:hypothetical protein